MMRWLRSTITVSLLALTAVAPVSPAQTDPQERHLLYVAVPGVRNYVEHGGVGILVFAALRFTVVMLRLGTLLFAMGYSPAPFGYDNPISNALDELLVEGGLRA